MNRKNKIDMEKQLSEFYSTLDYKPISANAISIYQILLQIDCKTDWLTEFKVTNTILMSKIKGLNISALQRARNELINNEYILYKKRSKSKRSFNIHNNKIIYRSRETIWTTERTTERNTERTSRRTDRRIHYN